MLLPFVAGAGNSDIDAQGAVFENVGDGSVVDDDRAEVIIDHARAAQLVADAEGLAVVERGVGVHGAVEP
jgi:hypothetical protein